MALNLLYLALLVACFGYAFFRGAAPERIGIAIIAASNVATVVVASTQSMRFRSAEVGILIVDSVTVFAFSVLALRAERFWPIWVSALLAIGVIGHAAKLANPAVIPWAYAFVHSIWSYPILLLLFIGTYRHQQRLKLNGADRSWTSSSFTFPGKRPPAGPPG